MGLQKGKGKALFQRIAGIFKNRLCAIKEYPKPPLLPVERCHEVLVEAFEVASSPDKMVAELGSGGVLLMVRMLVGSAAGDTSATASKGKKSKGKGKPAAGGGGVGALDVEQVRELYTGLFVDFMAKKRRQAPQTLVFLNLCQRSPEVGWHLFAQFAEGITTGANDYLRLQAMLVLKELLQRHSSAAGLAPAAVKAALSSAAAGLTAQFQSSSADADAAKVKYVRGMLAFATVLLKAIRALSVSVPTTELSSALVALLNCPLASKSPPVKTVATQLIRLLEGGAAKAAGTPKAKSAKASGKAAAKAAPEPAAEAKGAEAAAPTSALKKRAKAETPGKRKKKKSSE